MQEFSVLMSVYKNDVAENIITAVKSIIEQTVRPSQVVIVVDGPIPEDSMHALNGLREEYSDLIELYPLEQNVGLGNALKEGMQYCRYELIARMDSDDIAVQDRFEKQLALMEKNPDISIVGSDIAEFIGDIDNVVSVRDVPAEHKDICEYLKKRCPFNHMTVMFKKSEVEKAGGYLHWFYNEDSYLWARMYLAGCKFANIKENLVYARINEATFSRRGGKKYYISERDLFKFMLNNKIITKGEYRKCCFMRYVIQVLMPNRLRKFVFIKLMRQKPDKSNANNRNNSNNREVV